jgi:hypothetical protein
MDAYRAHLFPYDRLIADLMDAGRQACQREAPTL